MDKIAMYFFISMHLTVISAHNKYSKVSLYKAKIETIENKWKKYFFA